MTSRRVPKPGRKRIVAAVIAENPGLTEKQFFSDSRTADLVAVRRKVIQRLHADGAYPTEIANLIKRDLGTIRYHLNEENRHLRKANYHNWWRSLKADPERYAVYCEKRSRYVRPKRISNRKRGGSSGTDLTLNPESLDA